MRDWGAEFRQAYVEDGRIWMRFSSFDARDITEAVEPVIRARTADLERQVAVLQAEVARLRQP